MSQQTPIIKKYSTIWPNVPENIRKCEDGVRHSGNLEIVTWDTKAEDAEVGEALGWGACIKEESEDLRKQFENEMNHSFSKLYEYFNRAFRWTCCGLPGDYKWGCDHHFLGRCRCDNCKYGYQLPRGFVEDRNKSPWAKGLTLGEGNINGEPFE